MSSGKASRQPDVYLPVEARGQDAPILVGAVCFHPNDLAADQGVEIPPDLLAKLLAGPVAAGIGSGERGEGVRRDRVAVSNPCPRAIGIQEAGPAEP